MNWRGPRFAYSREVMTRRRFFASAATDPFSRLDRDSGPGFQGCGREPPVAKTEGLENKPMISVAVRLLMKRGFARQSSQMLPNLLPDHGG